MIPPATNAIATATADDKIVGPDDVSFATRPVEPLVGGGLGRLLLIGGASSPQQPECRPFDTTTNEFADDSTGADHENPIAEIENLIKIERDEQNAARFISLSHQLLVDEFNRANIETTGRLDGEQDIRLTVELAGDDQLLLIATGKRSGG